MERWTASGARGVHLGGVHELEIVEDDEIEDHAVGVRTCNYWCSFCSEVRMPECGAPEAREVSRFDHIEAHFLGFGGPRLGVSDWDGIFIFKSDR